MATQVFITMSDHINRGEQDDRRSLGTRRGQFRSAYLHPHVRAHPGSLGAAYTEISWINSLLESAPLTTHERRRLYRRRALWRKRLQGQDHRYNLVGNRPGRLSTMMRQLKEAMEGYDV